MNDLALVCILNYHNDENAMKLKMLFSHYFSTIVIDCANTKEVKEFEQYKENLYYSGMFNVAKKKLENNNYKWLGIICSDVLISEINISNICHHLQVIDSLPNVGQYQPSFDEKSYKWRGNNTNSKLCLEEKFLLDGPIFFCRSEIMQKFPYIDTKENLYGCGVGRCFSLFTRKLGYINIFDNSVKVTHLCKTGYPVSQSKIQAEKYISKFSNLYNIDRYLFDIDEHNNSLGEIEHKGLFKKVIYTCITGNYDELKAPSFKEFGYDYICFTDDPSLKSDFWEVFPIPKEIRDLSPVKQQRIVKIMPHKFLNEYETSIWIDANVRIDRPIDEFLKQVVSLNESSNIFLKKHPQRQCIYDEITACKLLKGINKNEMEKLRERYISEGMPKNFGLFETNVIIRKHNAKDCITLMNEWGKELLANSYRDQVSLTYCIWKLNMLSNITIYPYNFVPEEKFYKKGEPYYMFRGKHKKYISSQSIKLYSTYYKPEQLNKIDKNQLVTPYNTNNAEFPTNVLNKYWSEFIIMKNIWKKGKSSDFIGFDQYDTHFPYDNIISLLDTDRIIYYAKMSVTNPYRQFSACHTETDIKTAIDITNSKYGKDNKYTDYLNNGKTFYYKSCFVMSWDNFDKMCEFIFGILDGMDEKYNLSFNPDNYKAMYEKRIADGIYKSKSLKTFDGQCRGFGFVAERLISAWLWVNIPHDKIITIKDGEYKKYLPNPCNSKGNNTTEKPNSSNKGQESVETTLPQIDSTIPMRVVKKFQPKTTVTKKLKPANGFSVMHSLYGRY